MSDASPLSDMLSILRQIVTKVDGLADGQRRIEGRLTAVEIRLTGLEARLADVEKAQAALEKRFAALEERLTAVESRLSAVEAGLAALDGRVGLLEARVAQLETALDQTRHELLKLRVDVMDRLDRFQSMLENVRDSTAVTLMMDQRTTKRLKAAEQDRDDLFEQMMAMERQLMTLALRIDAIEEQRH